jgi:hypothetical protein
MVYVACVVDPGHATSLFNYTLHNNQTGQEIKIQAIMIVFYAVTWQPNCNNEN